MGTKMMKRFLSVTLIALLLCVVSMFGQTSWASDDGYPDNVYEVDNVYSGYTGSTNYTIGGSMYTDRPAVAVRPITTSSVTAGLTLPFNQEVVVTEQSAIVIDIMIYTNMTRTLRLEVVDGDDTVHMMVNDEYAYQAKDNEVVNDLLIGNSAFNNNLTASTGFSLNDTSKAYNQLVVPLTSFGFAIGETITVDSLNLYAPPWSTATYNKYLLMSTGLSSDFSTSGSFTKTSVWEAMDDTHELYGSAATDLDVRLLDAGELLMDPMYNSSGSGLTQDIIFKFPDELINESGLVNTADIAGLTIEVLNEADTAFNGYFKLYDENLSAIANSNYSNLKTHKITKDGTEADSNAKYFYASSNTVGYADAFVLYNFNSTDNVTSESTESFYCADGDLPEQISPYFSFGYQNSPSFSLEGFNLGTIRVLTNDTSVYENTATSSENVAISIPKGYVGNTVTYQAENNGREVSEAFLNENLLNEQDLAALFSPEGLSIIIAGDNHIRIVFKDELPLAVTANDPLHGSITLSGNMINQGEKVRALVTPDAGYEFDWLEVNGVDVTSDVIDQVYITEVTEEITFSAGFKLASEFHMEFGAISSLYNHYPGIVFATSNSVNVQTTVGFEDGDPEATVGITLTGIDVDVDNEDFLIIELHSLVNNWRTFYVEVNDVANVSTGNYYLINRYQTIQQKTGMGIITESSVPAVNNTLTIGNTEGFYGKIIIPMSSFEGVDHITNISVSTIVKNKSYARYNVSNVYLSDRFDENTGIQVSDDELIWEATPNNWTSMDENDTYSAVRYLNANDVTLQTVVANTFGYDSLYASFPQNMINEDGYVDLNALGVTGIAIDVENYNQEQHSLALRIAGSDNTSLTNTGASLWQTSISGHPASIIYPSGLVKSRNSAFIPYDESGSFSGTIYIPFDSIAFTSIGAAGDFPSLLQPMIRVLPGSMNEKNYDTYDIKINDIRFITDDSIYDTHQITMTQIGGSVSGNIDGNAVSNDSNNNVLNDTEVTFTVTPNAGYEITSLYYTLGDGEQIDATLDENHMFTVNVTDDLLVQFVASEINYNIIYDLNGGVNHNDNPDTYTVEDRTIILEAPTKEGYIFTGWVVDDQPITEILSGSMGDLTVSATWEIIEEGWFASVALWIKIVAPIIVLGGAATVVIMLNKKTI